MTTIHMPRFINEADTSTKPPAPNGFDASFYPYTYGYDFLRTHGRSIESLGRPEPESRTEAAGIMRDLFPNEAEREYAISVLADAYLAEHGITRPSA